jgi:hypothetical protein
VVVVVAVAVAVAVAAAAAVVVAAAAAAAAVWLLLLLLSNAQHFNIKEVIYIFCLSVSLNVSSVDCQCLNLSQALAGREKH